MTDWINLLCWYMLIIHNMRSCSEHTILYCVESDLYYILRSEMREKINRQYTYIVENIKFIYMCIRVLTSYSYLFRSEWNWIIYFPTIYVYCIYRVMSKTPKQLSNCLKRAEKSVVLIVFDCILCEVRAYKHKYCFWPSLNMNQVPENYILVTKGYL